MPRKSKGARLQLKAARRGKDGSITHRATWIIRDNGRDVLTGCAEAEVAAAETALQNYIADKYTPKRKAQDIEVIPLGDVLSIYLDAELAKVQDVSRWPPRMTTRYPPFANSRSASSG
jgi:hypothetical protein